MPAPRRRQQGVVLFIALIVLVAMTLAGIALFRQVGTGIIIAGNMTFKRIATAAADRGIEDGRTWLLAQSAAAFQSDGTGYYSSWQGKDNTPSPACAATPGSDIFNPSNHAWTDADSVLTTADDGGGNQVRWVVHRLCNCAGSVNGANQQCVSVSSAMAGGSQTAGGYGIMPISNTIQPYFRITVRVAGPRNTTSYVQVIMF